MSELTFTLLRLGFLVLLWVFVFSALGVLRRDLYGTRATSRRKKGERGTATATAGHGGGVAPASPAPSAPTPVVRQQAAAQAPSGPTRLVVTQGPLRGTTVPLSASSILIGRAPSCTLVLDDDYSSSRHARIFPQGGAWYVEDLGSTNGTYVGDQRLSGAVQLPAGVGVRIGHSVVELQR